MVIEYMVLSYEGSLGLGITDWWDKYLNLNYTFSKVSMSVSRWKDVSGDSEKEKQICAVYGDGSIAESTVRRCFVRFRSGEFDPKKREPSDRSDKNGQMGTLIRKNHGHMTRDVSEWLVISHMYVVRHFENTWIFKSLQCSDASSQHKCNKNDTFF